MVNMHLQMNHPIHFTMELEIMAPYRELLLVILIILF